MSRGLITDEQWSVVAPFLPPERGRGCRPSYDNRRFFNGMMWMLRGGAPWRDLPAEFGKWNSVYQRFNRWCRQGIFDGLLETLVELGITDAWRVQMVDSTVVRGHSQAAGAKGGPKIRDLAVRVAALRAKSTGGVTTGVGRSRLKSRLDRPPTANIFSP